MIKYVFQDDSFIKVGSPAVLKGTTSIVYITEILGDIIITTDGSYQRKDLSCVTQVAGLLSSLEKARN